MAHEHPRVWHQLREHVTHWVVAGVIIAATGFAPEHWVAGVLERADLPAEAAHLWSSGIDLRLVVMGVGVLLIAGDIGRRQIVLRPAQGGAATPAMVPVPPPEPIEGKPSLAVLPFANLGGDPQQEYFSDGVADDIITELSRSRDLFVIARNSSFTYRGRAVDVKQVARELGVRYVLEGSLRRDGERIRINAQLIDAETGNHVWAERYDRALIDMFAVQDAITEAVVVAILPAVADAEQRRAMRRPPANLGAWEAYQWGLWYSARFTPADNQTAKAYFRQAVERDPGFAAAYSALILACIDDVFTYGTVPYADGVAQAAVWARKTRELDPMDASAYRTLTLVGGPSDADTDVAKMRKIVEATPNSSVANRTLGVFLLFRGEPAESRAYLERSVLLNPRDRRNAVAKAYIAASYYRERDYARAVQAARDAITENPGYPSTYRWLAAALGQLGRRDEAQTALREAIARSASAFELHVHTRLPWFPAAEHEHMLEGLRKAGWQG